MDDKFVVLETNSTIKVFNRVLNEFNRMPM